ncbi:MAG: 5'/3'-nucleotidase SurE [Anaerolineales bacterium]|nr:5'/3'-nucleotidase SurE [Anaerolineales bacterium]MCB8953166.1 5'/3'-nucleotidase SurE [Ardenticatenales bacterium]
MHILVTNDDGVMAPGLLALAQAMRQVGEVSVVAPDRNWSGRGHVKTLHNPLRVRAATLADGSEALCSDGAPSDCVALALMGVVRRPVDLVVSGINPMANLGHDVTYSGTVTAAMESIIAGVPAIAFSTDAGEKGHGHLDYSTAARVARLIVRTTLTHSLPKGVFLNVNVPYLPIEEVKGIQLTRQGLRIYRDELEKRQDPRGQDYYWISGEAPTGVPEKGTDIGALAEGYVSVTPLQLDLTAYHHMLGLTEWGWRNGSLPPEPAAL